MSNTSKGAGKAWPRWVRPVVGFAVTVLLCLTFLVVVGEIEETKPGENPSAVGPVGLPVTVRSVTVGVRQTDIQAPAEVQPLWRVTLRSQVEGRVVSLAAGLQPGELVRKGELLVKLEDVFYRQQVQEAGARVAQARVVLLAEERESAEARKNWTRSGLAGEPDSALVLRAPQIAAAEAELAAAEATLVAVRQQLAHTEVRAPFDALVVTRSVEPGGVLFSGDAVAALAGIDVFEVAVPLSSEQWALLPDEWRGATVRLSDPLSGRHFAARAVRESRRLAEGTRLRTLYVHIDQPFAAAEPLLPGAMVRVHITGKARDNLVTVPESAYTRDGRCWFVDEENRLQVWSAQAVFFGEDGVTVTPPPNHVGVVRLAVAPHAGFTRGLTVQPLQGD